MQDQVTKEEVSKGNVCFLTKKNLPAWLPMSLETQTEKDEFKEILRCATLMNEKDIKVSWRGLGQLGFKKKVLKAFQASIIGERASWADLFPKSRSDSKKPAGGKEKRGKKRKNMDDDEVDQAVPEEDKASDAEASGNEADRES
jgi:hypothetical protein